MPGENLFKRGGVYYVRVQARGVERRISLRTSSLREAKKRRRDALEQADHARFYGDIRHSWPEAVLAWAASVPEIAQGTMTRYLVSLQQVRGILDPLFVDEITLREIAKIGARPGATNATRRRDLTAVSVVIRWCVAQGWRHDNPARTWDRSIIAERRDPILLPRAQDIDQVVAAAPGNFANLIRLAQYTGMREEECASLECGEIDLRRRAIQLTWTKTNRPRSVPLDERAVGTIVGTPRSPISGYVFWHGAGERYANVSSRFAAIAKKAARSARLEGRRAPQHFRFHDLRHWFAVDYLRRGGSIYLLQKILGHSSIKTTELYLDFLTPGEQAGSKAGPGVTVFVPLS